MLKKIKEQIANQTRPDIGFAKTGDIRGYRFTKVPKVRRTDISKDEDIITHSEFFWKKIRYLQNRTSSVNEDPNSTEVFYHAVPVVDTESYGTLYPIYTLNKDYYYLGDADNSNSGLIWSHSGFNSTDGSFIDQKLYHNSNILYQINLASTGVDGSVPIGVSANDVSVSIWYKHVGREDNYFKYSSFRHGLNGKTVVNIPISANGTTIYICAYNHDLKYGKTADLKIETDRYIMISADFTKFGAPIPDSMPDRIDSIAWDNPPIVASADPITWKLWNKLRFVRDDEHKWEGVKIYREISYRETGRYQSPTTAVFNMLSVDTSETTYYQQGASIIIGDSTANVTGTGYAPHNSLSNGDFSYFTGTKFTGWNNFCTSAGTVGLYAHTVLPYHAEARYGGTCCKLTANLTDTTKSCGIVKQDNTWPYAGGFISFWFKDVLGNNNGAFQVMFEKGTTGSNPCTPVSSAMFQFSDDTRTHEYITPNTETGWNHVYLSSADFGLPSDCTRYKLRFYSCYESTAPSVYLLDGFFVPNAHVSRPSNFLYSTANANTVLLSLDSSYEKPLNNRKSFKATFVSDKNSSNISVVSSCGAIWMNNNDWHISKFNYGVLLSDSATNYLQNSRFMGGLIDLWTTADGFYKTYVTSADCFSHTAFARFTGSVASYIEQSTANTGVAGNNLYAFGMWAKAHRNNLPLRVRFEDAANNVSSATFNLTTDWAKYGTYVKFNSGGDSFTTRLKTIDDYDYTIDIAGVQLEKDKDRVASWNEGYQSYGRLIYKNSAGAFDPDYGTIRLWYTPTYGLLAERDSSDPLNYRGIFYIEDSATGYYKSIYYNPQNDKFVFRQYNGTINETSVSPFKDKKRKNLVFEPIHLAATWDSDYSYIYADKNKSAAVATKDIAMSKIILGYASASGTTAYPADGVLSNVRVDKSKWSDNDVEADCEAERMSITPNSNVVTKNRTYIADKVADSDHFYYIDEVGLDRGYKYSYVFQSYRGEELSDWSDSLFGEVYSYSPKPGYEYEIGNKCANGSFELINNLGDGNPLYWEEVTGDFALDETYTYHGKSAYRLNAGAKLRSEYISLIKDIDNILPPYYLYSLYCGYTGLSAGQAKGRVGLKVYIYDTHYDLLDSADYGNASNYTSYQQEYFESDNPIIWDRPVWRWGNVFTLSQLDSASYCKVEFTASNTITIDAVQVEQDTVRAYRESPIVGSGWFPANSIDGNAIGFGTLVGRHLYAGSLVVSGHDSDANSILVGDAFTSGKRFIEITPEEISFNHNIMANTALCYIRSTAFYLGYAGEDARFFKATAGGIEIAKGVGGNTESFMRIAADEITMGEEADTEPFFSINRYRFRYHAADMDITDGYEIPRHIEEGSFLFGNTKEFTTRYVNYSGEPQSPKVSITPLSLCTFSTANFPISNLSSVRGQSVEIVINATAGGVYSNAFLIQDPGTPPIHESMEPFDYYSTQNDRVTITAGSSIHEDKGTYILDYTSKAKSVTLNYKMGFSNLGYTDANCYIAFYCTSESISSNPTWTQWNTLGFHQLNISGGILGYSPGAGLAEPFNRGLSKSFSGYHNRLANANTIGVRLSLVHQEAGSITVTCGDFEIIYRDTAGAVLKYGNDMGACHYLAIDGG